MARNGKQDNSPQGNAAREAIAKAQREHRRRNRGAVDAADWGSADAQCISSAISAVSQHGFAIRFGYTRDGGAFAIGIVGDGEAYTDYVRPSENIDVYLEGLAQDYRELDRD